jgi:hypothetical protein
MTIYKKTVRNLTFLMIAMLLLSFSGWLWQNNRALRKETNISKLRQDSILATKLILDKKIHDLNILLQACSEKETKINNTKK